MIDDVHEEFRKNVRRLAEEKIKPRAAELDRERQLPLSSIDAFRSLDLIGVGFPAVFGGQDGDLLAQVIAVEEVSRVCATSGLTLLTNWAALDPMVRFGPSELNQRVLPPIIAGQAVAAWCLTEPAGGSDLASITTQARRDGDGWVLDGVKRFITNATWAEWYLVLARIGQEKDFGLFLVHKDAKGLSFGAVEDKMGIRASPTADVIFEDCRVPADQVIVDTDGYRRIISSLSVSRPLIAALALGIAQGALDESVSYIRERTQFGQPLARFQLVRAMVAEMACKVEAGRAVLYDAARVDASEPDRGRMLASMAKLMCSNAAMEVTTDAVQLHGGYGYLKDYPVERMMRDAKITQIFEGTSQIQLMLIAKSVIRD